MHLTEQRACPRKTEVESEKHLAGAPVPSCEIEFLDNRLRQCREIVQRCNDRPRDEVVRFDQAYLHGEVYLGSRCSLGEESQYGFIIGAAHPSGGDWSEGTL